MEIATPHRKTPDIPTSAGPPADEAAKAMLSALQAGKVDRALLGGEFSAYLTDAKIKGAAQRLKPFGQPTAVKTLSRNERGGMEVSTVLFVCRTGQLEALLYRTPDGKIQQFFVSQR